MEPIKVLLVDDHHLVRAGIRALVSRIEGVTVVGEAENGREGIEMVQQYLPDVVLMDIAMSGLNGLEAVPRMVKISPQVRVIMLSMHDDSEYVRQALRAGASGYMLKNSRDEELDIALHAVAAGESYLSPAISKRVIEDYLRWGDEEYSRLDLLTPRQREVLQLLAEGNTMQQIAQILGVSIKTVETHRAQLLERLDIHDLTGLVRYAIRAGIVTLE